MNKKAQSVLEYAVLICVVVAALAAMQVYIKRGMQGRMRQGAEQAGNGLLYSPGATNGQFDMARSQEEYLSQYSEYIDGTKISATDYSATSSQVSSRDEEVLSFEQEPER